MRTQRETTLNGSEYHLLSILYLGSVRDLSRLSPSSHFPDGGWKVLSRLLGRSTEHPSWTGGYEWGDTCGRSCPPVNTSFNISSSNPPVPHTGIGSWDQNRGFKNSLRWCSVCPYQLVGSSTRKVNSQTTCSRSQTKITWHYIGTTVNNSKLVPV